MSVAANDAALIDIIILFKDGNIIIIVHSDTLVSGYGLLCLKLHNCFVYFIQTINPCRMVFYFFILLLRLLSY